MNRDDFIRARAAYLVQAHGFTMAAATAQAASEWRERHPPAEEDPPLQPQSWRAPRGRMTGAERNGQRQR